MNGAKSGVLSVFFNVSNECTNWWATLNSRRRVEGRNGRCRTHHSVCVFAYMLLQQKLSDAHQFTPGPLLSWLRAERAAASLSLPGRGQMINGVMWGHVTLSRRHNLAGCGPCGGVCSRLQPHSSRSFQKLPHGLMWSMFSVFWCRRLSGFAGTPGYLSPEVLRKDPYGKPVDIWACGESSAAAPPPDGADAAV